jgi:hypothetical protein
MTAFIARSFSKDDAAGIYSGGRWRITEEMEEEVEVDQENEEELEAESEEEEMDGESAI